MNRKGLRGIDVWGEIPNRRAWWRTDSSFDVSNHRDAQTSFPMSLKVLRDGFHKDTLKHRLAKGLR